MEVNVGNPEKDPKMGKMTGPAESRDVGFGVSFGDTPREGSAWRGLWVPALGAVLVLCILRSAALEAQLC